MKKSITGDYNDCHPYLFKFGINSVTIKGIRKTNKKMSKNEALSKISVLLESTLRSISVLDENLHAGSTMWLPTNKNNYISIAQHLYPSIAVIVGLAINVLVWLFVNVKEKHNFWVICIDFVAVFGYGMWLLIVPGITENIYNLLNFNNKKEFCPYKNENKQF